MDAHRLLGSICPSSLALFLDGCRRDPRATTLGVRRRVSKSLSDLDGTDPYIHDDKPKGLFRELGNALVRSSDQPTFGQTYGIYRQIKIAFPLVIENAGAKSLFVSQKTCPFR